MLGLAASPQPKLRSIYAVSDVHAEYRENMQWCEELSDSYRNDVLIVAGEHLRAPKRPALALALSLARPHPDPDPVNRALARSRRRPRQATLRTVSPSSKRRWRSCAASSASSSGCRAP